MQFVQQPLPKTCDGCSRPFCMPLVVQQPSKVRSAVGRQCVLIREALSECLDHLHASCDGGCSTNPNAPAVQKGVLLLCMSFCLCSVAFHLRATSALQVSILHQSQFEIMIEAELITNRLPYGPLSQLYYKEGQNPILIIMAPTLPTLLTFG